MTPWIDMGCCDPDRGHEREDEEGEERGQLTAVRFRQRAGG
jgi:hypothetical protein